MLNNISFSYEINVQPLNKNDCLEKRQSQTYHSKPSSTILQSTKIAIYVVQSNHQSDP